MAIPRARGTWVRRARWAFLSIWRLEIRRSTGNEWYIVVHSGNSGVSDIRISVLVYCTPYGVRRWDGMRWGSGEIKPSSDIHPIPSRSQCQSTWLGVSGGLYPCSCSSFTRDAMHLHTYKVQRIKIPHLLSASAQHWSGGGGFSFMMTMAKCIRRRGKLQVVHTWSPVYP